MAMGPMSACVGAMRVESRVAALQVGRMAGPKAPGWEACHIPFWDGKKPSAESEGERGLR